MERAFPDRKFPTEVFGNFLQMENALPLQSFFPKRLFRLLLDRSSFASHLCIRVAR